MDERKRFPYLYDRDDALVKKGRLRLAQLIAGMQGKRTDRAILQHLVSDHSELLETHLHPFLLQTAEELHLRLLEMVKKAMAVDDGLAAYADEAFRTPGAIMEKTFLPEALKDCKRTFQEASEASKNTALMKYQYIVEIVDTLYTRISKEHTDLFDANEMKGGGAKNPLPFLKDIKSKKKEGSRKNKENKKHVLSEIRRRGKGTPFLNEIKNFKKHKATEEAAKDATAQDATARDATAQAQDATARDATVRLPRKVGATLIGIERLIDAVCKKLRDAKRVEDCNEKPTTFTPVGKAPFRLYLDGKQTDLSRIQNAMKEDVGNKSVKDWLREKVRIEFGRGAISTSEIIDDISTEQPKHGLKVKLAEQRGTVENKIKEWKKKTEDTVKINEPAYWAPHNLVNTYKRPPFNLGLRINTKVDWEIDLKDVNDQVDKVFESQKRTREACLRLWDVCYRPAPRERVVCTGQSVSRNS